MKVSSYLILISFLATLSCEQIGNRKRLHSLFDGLPSHSGKEEYLLSPYFTAGDRVYAVGHQDGSFPDLGWHVTGEMGGVWDHPIKLMDGYELAIGTEDLNCLTTAKQFINYPAGNQHLYESKDGLTISRLQFAPDGEEGLIVEYRIENTTPEEATINISFTGYFDLRPVWLAEKKNIVDGEDSFTQEDDLIIAKDNENEWYAVLSSSLPIAALNSYSPCNMNNAGKGVNAVIHQEIKLDPNETQVVQYYISGSYQSKAAAITTNKTLKDRAFELLDEKIKRLSALNDYNHLVSSDASINTMFEWIKYNNDWLMRDVPEVGRGISAGIPDYPWWFGTDGGYAIEGLLAQGQWEEALSTIDLILKLSQQANGNSGKIMHEASTNGIVFNTGNLNTTPKFIQTLWKAYSWTGKAKLLDRYYQTAKKGIEWIESQDKDGNGYADGPGMMEIHGLHTEMIDVVAYQEQAYRAAANLAEATGDKKGAQEYRHKSDVLRNKINSEWWAPEFASYADFRATKTQAIELIEAAIIRADTLQKPWAVKELEATLAKVKSNTTDNTKAYVVHHNWVVNTPLETGSADLDKAEAALETATGYQNRFGMFVTGIDRDENQETATKWKAFSYVGAVMTLPTGVQAIGAARYGNTDLSYDYLKRLENSFSYALPGSMYEVSPDFGMVTQAWNNYAVAVPIVEYYFGMSPLAHEKTIILTPNMPSAWPNARMENIRIGDNLVTLDFSLDKEKRKVWKIFQTKSDWRVYLLPQTGSVEINREMVESENGQFELIGLENEIIFN